MSNGNSVSHLCDDEMGKKLQKPFTIGKDSAAQAGIRSELRDNKVESLDQKLYILNGNERAPT
jgi:hypothetical protein